MKRRFARLLSAFVFLSWGVFILRGAETTPAPAAGSTILQQELKQQQIKTTTQRVGDQLEGIIAEFDRNGISGEDVKVLRAIRGVLNKLSGQDMAKVIQFLQESRAATAATDETAATRTATEAFAGQKTIVVQLQQLVLEYQRQQALYEIALRLKELASRQTANMWLGVGLAKSAEGKTSASAYDENQKISLRYQQSEQNPLKDEVAAILAKLERLSTDITEGPAAERPKAALQQARTGGLTPALETAAEELREEKLKLLSAIGNEKIARDQMREIARMLILSTDTTDSLKQAILELDRAIDTQKKVYADTAKTKKKDEADKHATDQAIVVDDTDLIRKDIDSLAPIASELLKAATDKMQEARASLSMDEDAKKRVDLAQPRQEEAILQMQAARRALEEQLARAEAVAEQPEKSTIAALKEIQEQVRELIQKQEEHKQQAAAVADRKQLPAQAPKQGELKDKAQELQAGASSPSPDAAQSLGEAASQMQKSQNSLAQQQNNAPAQQAAIEALQRADQQLAQDIAKLEQAEKDLAQIEEMLKKLVAIIEEQQAVQFATTRQAVKPQPEPEPTKQLATHQEMLRTNTVALQQESAALVPVAGSHLGSAKDHMAAAKTELDKSAPKPAQPSQTEALADLQLARREFEKKINDLRDQLGLPPAQNTDALAEAQKRIEEAQKQVNQALEQLQQTPPGVMEALQKQQQEIAAALNELRQDSKNPQSIARAEQAAGEAAQRLAKSDLPGAIDSMKDAQKAIQQAQQQDTKPAQPGQKSPSLPNLNEQQAEVQKAAEKMLSAQKSVSQQAMQSAAEALQNANNAISPLSSGKMGQMPAGAQSALQSAQGSTSQGSAQASAGQNSPAQQSAASAAQALAQAQAALALAQAGVGSESAMSKQGEGEGEGEGQGQGKGKGKGKGQGKGQGQGQGQAQANAQGQGSGQPSPQGTGNKGNWDGAGGADGPRQGATGSSSFTKLPSRDRAALQQSQAEKYPQEYGPLVEQYLRNLSDQSGEK